MIADTLNLEPNYKKVIFGSIEFGQFKKEHNLFDIAIVHRIDAIMSFPAEETDAIERYQEMLGYTDYFIVGSSEVYYSLDSVINYVKRINTL